MEFHLAQIDQLPIRDASVDCVISNCVINVRALVIGPIAGWHSVAEGIIR